MKSLTTLFFFTSSIMAAESNTSASQTAARTSRLWTIFEPTPSDLSRDFETDRPDTTESPRTVPAGHLQAEISFYDYTRDKSEGITQQVDLIGAFNLKLGLLDNVDIQFVFDVFARERVSDVVTQSISDGFSDITTRIKFNLWGNDEGKTALALMPYVRIPAGSNMSNHQVEGGLIIPFSIDLSQKHSLGLMVQLDFVYDEAQVGYDVELMHSIVLGTTLGGKWGNYIEYFGIEGSKYRAYGSGGFTYSPRDNLQYDVGIRVGLNKAAEGFGVFTGVSIRY
jgi:hypothetical protein